MRRVQSEGGKRGPMDIRGAKKAEGRGGGDRKKGCKAAGVAALVEGRRAGGSSWFVLWSRREGGSQERAAGLSSCVAGVKQRKAKLAPQCRVAGASSSGLSCV